MNVKKSDSFYSIKCLTEVPESYIRWRCRVQYWTKPLASETRIIAPKSIASMSTKGHVEGLSKLDQWDESVAPLYTECLFGKIWSTTIRSTAKKAGWVSEKVHMDTKGTIDVHRKNISTFWFRSAIIRGWLWLTRCKRNQMLSNAAEDLLNTPGSKPER